MAFARRHRYNPKRKIAAASRAASLPSLEQLCYGGNPEHKRNPGDFGLTPPADPRPHKSLCDEAGIVRKQQALTLLQSGAKAGLVSERKSAIGGWPQNIWSVTSDGMPMEAQLENPQTGTYHGYPMPMNDPFREQVLRHWKRQHA